MTPARWSSHHPMEDAGSMNDSREGEYGDFTDRTNRPVTGRKTTASAASCFPSAFSSRRASSSADPFTPNHSHRIAGDSKPIGRLQLLARFL